MLLFLHIGTEKTGSSFIQSIIYYNRHKFKNHHIFVPKDNFEDIQIPKGQVSGGNGFKFYKLLKDKKYTKAYGYLNIQKKRAESLGCRSILLSNENLFRVLSENFDIIMPFFTKLNFDVKLCLFIRDPLEHIKSMYKHRNKNGKHQNFKNWLIHDYSTIKVLRSFSEKLESSNVNFELFTFLYEKSRSIKKLFFEDFLKINANDFIIKHKIVNKSLTFSEIFLLKHLFDKSTELRYKLSSKLQDLDQKLKADDPSILIEHHENIMLCYIKDNFEEIISLYLKFDVNLGNKYFFLLKKIDKNTTGFKQLDVSYSHRQLEALIDSISSEFGLKGIFFKIIYKFKNVYFQLKV